MRLVVVVRSVVVVRCVIVVRCVAVGRATLRLWRARLIRFWALAFSAIFCFCAREYLREETVAEKQVAQKKSANRDNIPAFTTRRNADMNKTRPKYENCTTRLPTAQPRLPLKIKPEASRTQPKTKKREYLLQTQIRTRKLPR